MNSFKELENYLLERFIDAKFNLFLEASDDNILDLNSDEELTMDDEEEEQSNSNSINLTHRKLIWLASQYDVLTSKLLTLMKRDSRYLSLLNKVNEVRSIFRFFMKNFKLYNENEVQEIAKLFEDLLRYFIEVLKKYYSEQ